MEEEGIFEMHEFASKLRACFQTSTNYTIMKVVPKAKVILPYLLLYYVFPSIVSLMYTLITQKYTIHHMHLDMQSLSGVDVCVEMPTLMVPGGTQIRNMNVNVGFGDSDVHAFTLVSRSLHEWKHLERVCIQDNMEIHHNEEFDAGNITDFVRTRGKVWLVFEFDLGVNVLLGSVYFRVKLRQRVDIFKNRDAKVFDIVDGDAAESGDAVRAAVQVRPRVPAFLRFSTPGFSLEAYGMTGDVNAKAHRLFTVSAAPFRWTEHSTAVPCTVSTGREDIENIRDMVRSVERRVERSVMVFRASDIRAFSAVSRRYIDAAIRGIVIAPEENDSTEVRRGLKEPLIRIGISKVTLSDARGFVCVHRALFPNSYIYELARNVRYETCGGRVDLEGVKIASGYFHNRAEHPDQYVRCEFWGEIHDWALLMCRVLHPEDEILSLGADGTHSMFSRFLEVWRVLVDFRKGIQATSLGCMKPRPAAVHGDLQNNVIEVRSRVVEDERALLRISTTIQTMDYRSSPYAVLEVSEDQCLVIPGSLLRTSISVKKGEAAFNIEESLGRTVSIGSPAEIDVVFEKLGDFDEVDRSCCTVDESIYHLLVLLLCGERKENRDLLERILESYVMSSCAESAFSLRKTSVMVQEILGYDRYKVLFAFQGEPVEEAIVNIELSAPSLGLNVFPLKGDVMSRQASVRTEISPFALRLQVSRRGVALQETETILPLSIFVKFAADLMTKRFTFMHNNEEPLLTCMANFCMNFFQGSLEMFSAIKHEKREQEQIKHFSSTVPEVTLDVDVDLNNQANVCAKLHIEGDGNRRGAFSIDTEKIRISAVGHIIKNNYGWKTRNVLGEVFRMEISPLGINLRQKNNTANFYQRDVDVSVWSQVCISGCDLYDITVEYGEKHAHGAADKRGTFELTKEEFLAIVSFLRGFYEEEPPLMPAKGEEKKSILQQLFSAMRSFFSSKKKDKESAGTEEPKKDAGTIHFDWQELNTASEEGDDKRQQVVGVRCSYDVLRANRVIGAIIKRTNLERYPQMFSLRTNLRLKGSEESGHILCYKIVFEDFPIMYQDPCLRRCDETFRVRVEYPARDNMLMLRTLKCKGNRGYFISMLSNMGLTSLLCRYDEKNKYFSAIRAKLKANKDLCVEVYSDERLSFKLHTAAHIFKNNTTILPILFAPVNFNRQNLNILVNVYVNTSLIYQLRIQSRASRSLLHNLPDMLLSNIVYDLVGFFFFSHNNDVEIDKREFDQKFAILKPPRS